MSTGAVARSWSAESVPVTTCSLCRSTSARRSRPICSGSSWDQSDALFVKVTAPAGPLANHAVRGVVHDACLRAGARRSVRTDCDTPPRAECCARARRYRRSRRCCATARSRPQQFTRRSTEPDSGRWQSHGREHRHERSPIGNERLPDGPPPARVHAQESWTAHFDVPGGWWPAIAKATTRSSRSGLGPIGRRSHSPDQACSPTS